MLPGSLFQEFQLPLKKTHTLDLASPGDQPLAGSCQSTVEGSNLKENIFLVRGNHHAFICHILRKILAVCCRSVHWVRAVSVHIENLLLTPQIKPSFLSLITPGSSSGYYNDWYFMCIQQRRKINCRIIRVNNTFLITFKIMCSLSHGIFQWVSGPRRLWDLLSFCSVCSFVSSHKGGQDQLLPLNIPKVYRLETQTHRET